MPGSVVHFPNVAGEQLAGSLELPVEAVPRAFAVYAHCFICGKNIRAAVDISRALCAQGIAVLRFDFTGLGDSAGNLADTTLSGNVSDLVQAARFLAERYAAPKILIGHSLGGAAVLEAAHRIESCIAVATIAAPANPEHVIRLFGDARRVIEERGEADVVIAGRKLHFKKALLDDLRNRHWQENIGALRKPLLIFHSPTDATVDISNAGMIFSAARHPKSFVSLSGADHLLSRREDSEYVGRILAAWASKYLGELGVKPAMALAAEDEVRVQIGRDHYHTRIMAGGHPLIADEPQPSGGEGTGPSPYDYLASALGACTAITLRMYADRRAWPLEAVNVRLTHGKIHARDCAACETREGLIDEFTREIELRGPLSAAQRQRLLEIAERCPVQRTLQAGVRIKTRLAG